MGAVSFTTRFAGTSMYDAFENAQFQAQHDYGNDPYNGTISTVDDCVEFNPVDREFTKDSDIYDYIDEMFDEWLRTKQIQKWDRCVAIKSVERDDTWIFTGLAAC